MNKEELLDLLAPFTGELDLVIEFAGDKYSIERAKYGMVRGSGLGVVVLIAGEEVKINFSRTVEMP